MAELLFLVVAVVAVVMLFRLLVRGKPTAGRTVYQPRARLFTPAERSFLGVLDQACGDQYRVFGKVRVADLLMTVKGLSNSDRQIALNKITAKHVDFVLCDPKTLDVKAAVELNDSSHKRTRRADRDVFLRSAFDQAGLQLIEIQAQRSYSIEAVRATLAELESSGEPNLE